MEPLPQTTDRPPSRSHQGRGGHTRWQPGQSANPAGRPVGCRNKLAQSFLETLSRDFAEHGQDAINRMREEDPSGYIKVVAALVPRELDLTNGEGQPLDVTVSFVTKRVIDVDAE